MVKLRYLSLRVIQNNSLNRMHHHTAVAGFESEHETSKNTGRLIFKTINNYLQLISLTFLSLAKK